MRILTNKRSSTKSERIFAEILKRNHIPFRLHVKEGGIEIDFIVGNYAIELDGHPQKGMRNRIIIQLGYNPLHYHNNAMNSPEEIENDIRNKYGLFSKNSSRTHDG